MTEESSWNYRKSLIISKNSALFQRTEEAVEYLNPIISIRSPTVDTALVTAFADVGRYSKPQTLSTARRRLHVRHIAQWKHIVKTDLTDAFYQIPLAQESMKYCGVATPFKGVVCTSALLWECQAQKLP